MEVGRIFQVRQISHDTDPVWRASWDRCGVSKTLSGEKCDCALLLNNVGKIL